MCHRLMLLITSLFTLTLALSSLTIKAQTPLPTRIERDQLTITKPDDLNEAEWTDIRHQIQTAAYHLTPLQHSEGDVGYHAPNPANDFGLTFDQAGLTVRPNQPQRERRRAVDPTDLHTMAWDWDLSLQGYGYETAIQLVTEPATLIVDQNRVEYVYDLTPQSNIVEWYENRAAGLKHGFTLNNPPTRGTGAVVLQLQIQTPLQTILAPGRQALHFQNDQGQIVLKYDGLYVYDANQQPVPARFTLNQIDVDHINIVIDDQHARYPLTVNPLLTSQITKLTAADGEAGDRFGETVAISGDNLVVGAAGGNNLQGAVYLFERNRDGSDIWGQVKKVTAADGEAGDLFGTSVSINDDTLFVGAIGNDDQADNAGAVYLFERNQGGIDNWGQIKKITASDGAAGDRFGLSVAISDDTLLVGANGNDDQADDAGAAYLFERNQGGADNWGQVKKLTADDGAAGDFFGRSVTISGDTLLIGVSQDDIQGAAYLFKRNQGGADNWGQVKKFTAPGSTVGDQFGRSVAISGDTLFIGASGDNDQADNAGAVYLFERNQGGIDNWGQIKKITTDSGSFFGEALAISNDTLLVASPGEGGLQGAVYLFERNQGGADNWGQVTKLTAVDGAASDQFGYSMAISGDTLLIGTVGSGSGARAAYLFNRQGNLWQQVKKPIASDGVAGDYFGRSVAISNDTLLVGAFQANDLQGVAYLFERNQGGADNWGQIKKITASDGAAGDRFGLSVAISGDTLLVGATGDNGFQGAAYLFERNQSGADNWGQIKKITAPDGVADDRFGRSVAISDETVLVGASGDNDFEGAAYLFQRNQGGADNWGQIKKITAPDGVANDQFGRSVAISNDILLIGAYFDNNRQGAAYLFERNQDGIDNWGFVKKFIVADGTAFDRFGRSVAISYDTLLIGASEDDNGRGSAYLFQRNQGGADNWGQAKKLTADDGAADDNFGESVAIDKDTLIVGAYGDNSGQGAAYLFQRNQGGADNWGQVKKFTAADGTADDNFGWSVAINGNTLPIGAYGDESLQGAAYVFKLTAVPSLSFSKTVDVSNATNGQLLTYRFIAENSGLVAATQAIVSDTLPSGLTFVGPVTIDGTTGTAGTPPHLASDLTIGVGQRITVTMPVIVNDKTEGQTLINTATITSSEVETPVQDQVAVTITSSTANLVRLYLPALLKD